MRNGRPPRKIQCPTRRPYGLLVPTSGASIETYDCAHWPIRLTRLAGPWRKKKAAWMPSGLVVLHLERTLDRICLSWRKYMANQSVWRGAELIHPIPRRQLSLRCGWLPLIAVWVQGRCSWKRSSPGQGPGTLPTWTWVSLVVIVQRGVSMSVLGSGPWGSLKHFGLDRS